MSGKSVSLIRLYEMWMLNNWTVYEASTYTSCHWTYPPVSFRTTLCYVDVVSNNNRSLSTFNFQQSASSEKNGRRTNFGHFSVKFRKTVTEIFVSIWLYCDYFIWCVSCTVIVCNVCMCGFCNVCMCVFFNVWVCVCVGFVVCGCFGNMCTCIYCL